MKVTIPKNQIPKQVNIGEGYGDLISSWNLDLTSNPGKTRVSPRLLVNTSSDNTSTMVYPVAFVRNTSNTMAIDTYFAVCQQAIFTNSNSNLIGGGTFTTDPLASSPTTALSNLYSDAVTFDGDLVVSLKTTAARLTAGVWSASWYTTLSGSPTLTNGVAHPLCVGFNNLLLIGNGNYIATVTTGGTVSTTRIILPTEYEVIWIRSSNTTYWIGTRHKFGGIGKVFGWDGKSENFTQDYKVGSDIVFAGVIKDEIPYIVNGNGQLLGFNGGGFSEIARFPIADDKINQLDEGLTTYPINVNRNGMALINNNIHIFLNAGINTTKYTFIENMLSGIWEYTPETGLYHKYGISKNNDSNINDFGSPKLIQAGALMALNSIQKLLAGAQLYKADGSTTTTEIGVINYVGGDAKAKMAYYVTPKIYTQEADEMWQKVFLIYEKLKNTGDFITMKYRTSKNFRSSFDQAATWASTTTFTTTATEFSGVSVGDEVEILSGEGSGLSANITAISGSGTYTVTIDTTVTGASGTFQFRINNWTKISSITDLVMTYQDFSVGIPSNWIQYKVIMYGTGSATAENANSPEIEKLISLSTPQVKAI